MQLACVCSHDQKKFPFVRQLDVMDCGAACLSMVCKSYGKTYPLHYLRQKASIGKDGSSLAGLMQASESVGLKTFAAKLDPKQLIKLPLPAIMHWGQVHYVVLYNIKGNSYFIADPGSGRVKLSKEDFLSKWLVEGDGSGIALLLEPNKSFYEKEINTEKKGLGSLLNYLRSYYSLFLQVFIGLFLAAILGMILPFLTQAIVDIGIQTEDIGFIYLICMAQLMVFAGRAFVELIRSRVLMHIGSRVSIALLSDFLYKLMKLPAGFFDARKTAGHYAEDAGPQKN